MQFEILNNLDNTGFYEVFCNNKTKLPEQIFKNKNWKAWCLNIEHPIFKDEMLELSRLLDQFFQSSASQIYLAPCLLQQNQITYTTIKFDSKIGLNYLPYFLPNPFGEELLEHSTTDFLWDDTHSWGIYHFSKANLFLLGYDESIYYTNLIQCAARYHCIWGQQAIIEYDTHSINEEKRQKYIEAIKYNNPWFLDLHPTISKTNIKQFELLETLDNTGFHEVFCSQHSYFPTQLFKNKTWKALCFDLKHNFFDEENAEFVSNFDSFFQATAEYVYIAPCIDRNYVPYSTIKFASKLTLQELPYAVPQPHGQAILINWSNDFLWNDCYHWGIYHFPDAGLLFLGYDISIQKTVDFYFGHLDFIMGQKNLVERLTHWHDEQGRTEYIEEMKINNPWFLMLPLETPRASWLDEED